MLSIVYPLIVLHNIRIVIFLVHSDYYVDIDGEEMDNIKRARMMVFNDKCVSTDVGGGQAGVTLCTIKILPSRIVFPARPHIYPNQV